MEPRLAMRRKLVAEERARRNVGRLLRFLLVVIGGAAVAWTLQSPWLSVARLDVTGVSQSTTQIILERARVQPGTPMILIRAGAIEKALLDDPWVAQARVETEWPGTVKVTVVERVPVAWVELSEGWRRLAVDGMALPGPPEPDGTLPLVHLPDLSTSAASQSPMALGALEFVVALADQWRAVITVRVEEGELWASVTGLEARLGRPIDMAAKARSLSALLATKPAAGSVLNVIAPTNPAVSPPQASP